MPVFGICRGAQTLNVARGGDLHQHLPELDGDEVAHRQSDPGEETVSHSVEVEPGTRLAEIVGAARRSRSTRFITRASAPSARTCVISARSERRRRSRRSRTPDRPFVIGVQWHAEFLVERPDEAALFRAFVDAALDFDLEQTRSPRPRR